MLKQLKAQLATSIAGLAALQTKAFADDSTEADLTALKDAVDAIDQLKGKIEILQRAETHAAEGAKPADGAADRSVPASVKAAETVEEKLALACQSMIVAKREYGSTSARNVLKAMEDMGYGKSASEFGQINKANTTLTGASGGFLVAENFDRSFIDLLYAESSFVEGGPQRIPMPEGNYKQAGALTGATATYRGEGDDIAVSNPTFREIDMSAHLLSNIVPVTNQLLRYSLGQAGEFIRNDGATAMSLKMDQTAYLGSGAGDVPLGVMNLPGINKVASTAGANPTVAAIEADARKLLGLLTRYPILRRGAAWRMSPRTILNLSMLRGADDQLIYPTLNRDGGGTWLGLPVRQAQFPENLGTNTDETYIALISFGTVLLGEAKGLTIDISSEASFRDTNGELQSAFSTDSTLFRFTMEHDFDARFVQSVNVLTGVRY